MEQLRQLISNLSAALGRLTPRERGLVGLAGSAVTVFLVVVIALTVSRSIAQREGRLKTKRGQLEEVARLTVGFRAQEAQRQELERRLRENTNVRLFTYLEELAKKDNLSIGGMNPKAPQLMVEGSKITEESVEVNFTRISLDKLVKFLADVEATRALVKVTRLQLRPRTDEPVLDAWLTVTTYTLES